MPGEDAAPAHRLQVLRAVPLLLFALLAGVVLIVANPGLFWDDWVWVHQSSADNIQSAKELGVWWAGHLSNAIWSAPDPVLLMRSVALIGWAVGAGAFVHTMRQRDWIDRNEAVLVFVLVVSAHVGLVRFVTSVAMYNVYIACFWLGCAILAHEPKGTAARLGAAALFFVSFHLNSMLVMYGLVLVWLFAGHARQQLALLKARAAANSEPSAAPQMARLFQDMEFDWTDRRKWPAAMAIARMVGSLATAAMLRRDWLFIALPFVFFVTIKLVSLALSTVLASQQRIYSGYNSVRPDLLLSQILSIPAVFTVSLLQYFSLAFSAVGPKFMAPVVLVGAALGLLLPWRGTTPGLRRGALQVVGGIVIFAAGVYPYLVVGKPPVLGDFHEARNIMPSLAGLALVLVGCANAGATLFSPFGPAFAVVCRNIGIGAVVGMAVSAQCKLGLDLTRDWLRQEAIKQYFMANRTELDRFGTFLFVDHAGGFRVQDRQIWNYEYTGALVQVFGRQTKLGIAVDEYDGWRQPSPLLHDPIFRRRYNLSDHDPRQPHAVVEIGNGRSAPSVTQLIETLVDHGRGREVGERALGYLRISHAERLLVADRNVETLRRLVSALEAYRSETGLFPHTTPVPPQMRAGLPPLPLRLPGPRAVPAELNRLPGIASRHGVDCLPPGAATEACRLDPACFTARCGFLFMSDGVDYKLVHYRPIDMSYARQAYPELLDPIRQAYGFWTLGAERW